MSEYETTSNQCSIELANLWSCLSCCRNCWNTSGMYLVIQQVLRQICVTVQYVLLFTDTNQRMRRSSTWS